MIKFLSGICSVIIFAFISCNQNPDTKHLEEEIISTDKAMSDLAVQEGFMRAILHYADSNLVKFNDGNYPVIGKKLLKNYIKISRAQRL